MSKENRRVYKNDNLTVFWDLDLCNHSTICFSKLARVFNPKRKPWINLYNGPDEKIIKIVNECPTLALTFCWNDPEKNKTESSKKLLRKNGDGFLECSKVEDLLCDDSEVEDPPTGPLRIKIIDNGPLIILGEFTFVDVNGNESELDRLSLCVCGKSSRGHVCDGTHLIKK